MYATDQEVCSVIIEDDHILCATYHYKDGKRVGSVQKYTNDIAQALCTTTGTFAIKTYNNLLYAANFDNVSIVNKKVVFTESMNTSIDINNEYVITSQDKGCVSLFDTDLNKIDTFQVCTHTIWICKMHNKNICAGCDCGRLIVFDIESKAIVKTETRESGITSIHFRENKIYVGSYDESIFVYDITDMRLLYQKKIGGGIWNIIDIDNYFLVACMYDGVKILTNDLEIAHHIKTTDLVYAVAYKASKLVYSEFYAKKLYSCEVVNNKE